jgi:rhodanese-related sulfurtransferase
LVVEEVVVHTLAAAHADGAIVVDVREPYEYISGHVPGPHEDGA